MDTHVTAGRVARLVRHERRLIFNNDNERDHRYNDYDDPTTDVALVATDSSLAGHVFTLAPTQPRVGTEIGVIGYADGGPVTCTTGPISGLERTRPIGTTAFGTYTDAGCYQSR